MTSSSKSRQPAPNPDSQLQIPTTIELWPLDRLKPYERNARTHSAEQVGKIAASIVEFGFTNPILVDGKDGIIAGHGRLMAEQRLKLPHVPVVVLDHLTDAQRRAYILADNRLALDAGWDEAILAHELDELRDLGYDLELTGFNDKELADLIGSPDDPGVATKEDVADIYTTKIKAPIYTPKGEKPEVASLCNQSKTEALLQEIEAADIPEEDKEFLRLAAFRHNVFNYESIAEYYCHAPKAVQELMENSALVIIDFDRAIENGFVRMTKLIAETYASAEA